MSGITLHDKLGVNPRLTYCVCPVCGKEQTGEELLLLGSRNYIDICDGCGAHHIGGVDSRHGRRTCSREGCGATSFTRRELSESERIPLGAKVCEECAALQKLGIIMISVRDGEEGESNPYRTGAQAVITEDAVKRLISSPKLLQQIIRKRMCYVPDSVWDMLGLPRANIDNRPAAETNGPVQ